MRPAATLITAAARWLLIVLTLGVLIRSAFIWGYVPGPFMWGDLIHAHSHTAYFGWAGLGLMGMILFVLPRLTGAPLLLPEGATRWLIRLAPWAVGGQLLAFALYGYNALSIGFSTLNEVLWFLFAYIFWQNVKARPVREWPPALWLIGTAVALLLLSTLGTVLVIVARVILKTYDPVFANLGVYLFLQVYGDGWLEVGLMGVAAALLGGLPSRGMARWQALLSLTLMAPASLRLLTPFGLEGPLLWLGTAAGLGLGAAQILFLLNVLRAPERPLAAVRPWWMLAAAALLLKAVLEAAPLLPVWTAWSGERQLVIAFLHLKLLAVFTAGLIGALGYVTELKRGWAPFAAGTLVMVGALAAHGFWADGNPALGRSLYVLAFGAGLLSALGGMLAVWTVARLAAERSEKAAG